MRNPRTVHSKHRVLQASLAGFVIGVAFLTSACGGSPTTQQAADQAKAQLNQILQHAQSIGVPAASLKPIEAQKNALDNTHTPWTIFGDNPANQYNINIDQRYQQLATQTQGLIATTGEEFQLQAQQDMSKFNAALNHENATINIKYFSKKFDHDQSLLAKAKNPSDYAAISHDANQAVDTLSKVNTSVTQLNNFKKSMDDMQKAGLSVTAMQKQYQNDQQTLNNITSPGDVANLSNIINAQYQETVVVSNQALPYVGAAKVQDFQQQISILKTYGQDTGAYQTKLTADKNLLAQAKTAKDYQHFSQKIDADMASMSNDMLTGEAHYLYAQLKSQVNKWSNAHMYNDPTNGQSYSYIPGYLTIGVNSFMSVDDAFAYASTPSDYQDIIDKLTTVLYNLQVMESNFKNSTPWDKVHTSDMNLIDHYNLQDKQVIVVSLTEQAMRIYQSGHLTKAFQVTTGQPDRPSEPGVFHVLNRESHMTFKSTDPKSSPFWYPPTPINYGLLYEIHGYFIHDATWRGTFGPDTQFPHNDSDPTGSHGCVNLPLADSQWVFDNTDWNTTIVIY